MPLHAIAMCPDAIDTIGWLCCIEKRPTDQSKKKDQLTQSKKKTNWPSLKKRPTDQSKKKTNWPV